MLRTKLVLLAAMSALALGQPAPALARDCEDICGELAAKNCKKINSFKCTMYIAGCLLGCEAGKLLAE
jgi:predicted nucleic acid-binding Zn ribbon protein